MQQRSCDQSVHTLLRSKVHSPKHLFVIAYCLFLCVLQLAEGGSLYSRLYSRSSASKAQQQQRQRQQQQQALAPGSRSSGIPTPLQKARKAGAGSSSGKGALPPPLSVSEVLRIAVDVSRAMVYLHTLQPQVVHRDLKPQNVLLDLQGRAKVKL